MGDVRRHCGSFPEGQGSGFREGCGEIRHGGHSFGTVQKNYEINQNRRTSCCPLMIYLKKGSQKSWNPRGGIASKKKVFPLGVEEHQHQGEGEKGEAPRDKKDDLDPMNEEEVKRLVEERKQPFNVRHLTMVELWVLDM